MTRHINILLAVAALFFRAACCLGANHFVLPLSAGSNTGADWNNAWALTNITWSSVAAGDSIWVAGGTYTTASGTLLSINKSGSSSSWINIMRATTNDFACTNTAGWLPANGTNCYWCETYTYGTGVTNYNLLSAVINVQASCISIDGRTTNGITLVCNTNYGIQTAGALICGGSTSCSNVIIANMGMVGPFPPAYTNNAFAFSNPGQSVGISIYPPANGYGMLITISNCEIRGHFQALYMGVYLDGSNRKVSGVVADHCQIHNIGGDVSQHSDLFYACMTGPLVVRYCNIWDWSSMVLFMFPATNGIPTIQWPIYVYGNLFHDPSTGSGCNPVVFENSTGFTVANSVGPLYWFNNTHYNTYFLDFYLNPPNTLVTSSKVENSIFIGTGGFNGSDSYGLWDYNYSSKNTFAVSEPNGINNTGIDPLVSPGVLGNYNIVSTIGSSYPRNKGTTINSISDPVLGTINFTPDANGNAYATPNPSMGAFEYAAGVTASSGMTITAGFTKALQVFQP